MRIPLISRLIKRAAGSRAGLTLPIKIDKWASRSYTRGRTPILENIYSTIASEFAKIELFLVRDSYAERDGKKEHVYEKLTEHLNYDVLNLRPNMLQTKSDFLYTVAYQLHTYCNALIRIVRAEAPHNHILALEPINCGDYLFGQGYDINGVLWLKLKEKKTGSIMMLEYDDIIHLRLNPNDIFYGDQGSNYDLGHFVSLFDENLSVLLTELKDAGVIRGIVEIGGPLGTGFDTLYTNQENKIKKQEEVMERVKATSGGIVVLDSGEKWHSLSREIRTMSAAEVDNLMKYLYNFKGINQAVIDGTATEAQMQVFFNKTIMPMINQLMEEMNYKVLTQTARTQGQKIDYFKNPFEYMSAGNKLRNLYLGATFLTQNEIRYLAFNHSPLPGGDFLMDNKNFSKPITGGDYDNQEPENDE